MEYIEDLPDILTLPCDDGGACPGALCADYKLCFQDEKLTDARPLETAVLPEVPPLEATKPHGFLSFDIKTDLIDSRRKVLFDFCEEIGTEMTSCDVRVTTDSAFIFIFKTLHATLKNVAGCKGKIEIYTWLSEYEKSAKVFVGGQKVGEFQNSTMCIEIGKNCITYTDPKGKVTRYTVAEQLRGAYIYFGDTTGFSIFSDLAMDDALLLCRHFKNNTVIYSQTALNAMVKAAQELEATHFSRR